MVIDNTNFYGWEPRAQRWKKHGLTRIGQVLPKGNNLKDEEKVYGSILLCSVL